MTVLMNSNEVKYTLNVKRKKLYFRPKYARTACTSESYRLEAAKQNR